MSGKSTYLRQNALILVMAQSGGYCPAESVNIGICDKLFCRLGSGDELAKGNSTFMVEMIETANILNSASDKSLVVLDEIGRGTSTFDGMSLAWAIIEYLIEKIKCKTLFATHYNELSQLKKKYNQIKLNTFKVKEWENELIFLHELIEGVAESSYGIQVAKMAGIPNQVTLEAKKILKDLENKTVASNKKNNQTFIDFELKQNDSFVKDLKKNISSINLNNITPIEALNVLEKIKKQFLKNLNKDNLQ
jgi:DNA mismatch repair protein MutS